MKKIFTIILSLLLLGCVAAEKKPEPAKTFESPDHEQIYNVIKKFTDTINARDQEGLLSIFADNAMIESVDQNRKKHMVTKKEYAEILSSWKLKNWKQIGFKCKFLKVKDVSVEGNKANVIATFKFYGHKFSRNDTLKFPLVKANGQWLILQMN